MKRNIYLATESAARRKIFKIFGLKFRVLAAKTKEKISRGKLTYAGFVKRNALEKAMAVAKKIKSGIVIAADTITVQDKKIFGKPASIKDAKKMLKQLSARPQDVYTGLAVIDKDRRIKLTACEKTRVYMDNLSDKEIKDYFSKVNPLNKAGSFDIQGKGAFFIRRIEGCFYNVVGLPLRKLYLMLKKLNIKVFVLLPFAICPLLLAILSGCSSEYNIVTGEQELYYYSTDQEVTMGKAIAKQVDKEYKPVNDPLIQKRVSDIGKKIAAVCDRKEISYAFEVLDDDEVNAFSLPGGFVYVNKGLVDKVANDSELACVLAHEVVHIVARHSIKKLQAMQGYSILRILISVAPTPGQVGAAADTAFAEIFLGYSREDELLADQLGSRYAKLAGYDPRAMITFLKKLQEVNRRMPLRPRSYLKTHPYVPDRIRIVKQELGEGMNFKDYINIEDQPHAK